MLLLHLLQLLFEMLVISPNFTVLLITSHLFSERQTDVLKKAAALEVANWDDRSPARLSA